MLSQPKEACLICGSSNLEPFFKIPSMPVRCNFLWDSAKDALKVSRNDIYLIFCHNCGYIFNNNFNSKLLDYSGSYENSLHFSPHYQAYSKKLGYYLVERYNLRHKTIMEIGCGAGEFLMSLCALGGNKGIGFDPSISRKSDNDKAGPNIQWVAGEYSLKYSDIQADLVVCRHVLEHLYDPLAFLSSIKEGVCANPETILFIEIPNAQHILNNLAVWDIIYEHCSYFSLIGLDYLLSRSGFRVLNKNLTFGEQYICVEATPALREEFLASPHLEELANSISRFATRYEETIQYYRKFIDRILAVYKKVVIWGAGSKTISFLNTFPLKEAIRYVIDINPRKQGKYIAGTGQKILSPEFLVGYKPEVILLLNPVYEGEIRDMVVNGLGLTANIECLA